METIAFGFTYAIAAAFCGLGLGLVGMKAMEAIGRNPEAQPNIIGLVVALIIKFVK